MNITRLALDNSRATVALLLMILLLGLSVYGNYPSREDPLVEPPVAVVSASFPGMPPEQMENLVTSVLEEKIREISEVKTISSYTTTGEVFIEVSLYDGLRDLAPIWQRLRTRLDQVTAQLPPGVHGPWLNDEYVDVSILTLALTGEGWSMAELREEARGIRDGLYALPGIARVSLHGLREERVFIETRSAAAEASSVDLQQMIQAVQDQNRLLPSGTVLTRTRSIPIETSGKLNSQQELRAVHVPSAEGDGVLPLADISDIRAGYEDPPVAMAFYNGKPALILSAGMQKGLNILELGPRVEDYIERARQSLPLGMQLDISVFQPRVVDQAIDNVKLSLYQTLGIVLLVVVLALGFAEGLVVGFTVPLTMLASLIVMAALDIDLQFVSLVALMVSLGMLVDNGIVMAESMHVRMEQGHTAYQAACYSGRKLTYPLFTSTLTTVLAFAPILFAETQSAQYMRSLSQVVSISLALSWLISLVFVPLLLGAVRKLPHTGGTRHFVLQPLYTRCLAGLLRHPGYFFGGLLLLLLLCGASATRIESEMFPNSARSEVLVYLDLPAGYHIMATESATGRLTDWLLDADTNPEVDNVTAYIGTGGPRFFLSIHPMRAAPHRAFLVVNCRDSASAAAMTDRIRRYVAAQLPEARVRADLVARGVVPPGVVQLRFSGPDASMVYAIAREAEQRLRAIDDTLHVYNDWENPVMRRHISIDRARAARAGVSYEDIALGLDGFFSGNQVSVLRREDTIIPIVSRGVAEERAEGNDLLGVKIRSSGRGEFISLAEIAEIEERPQFCCINRRNLVRTATVSGMHGSWKSAQLQASWDASMADWLATLPDAYRVELGGELESIERDALPLFKYLPIFLVLIVIALVIQFRSYRKTLVICLSIPLALLGAMPVVALSGKPMDFNGSLGLLALAGIIINNAIVLIDRIDRQRAEGTELVAAIIMAASERLRPILVTTLTTILGLMPLLLMEETLFHAFALVVMGGLAIGTVMTLGFVPLMYYVMFGILARRMPAADRSELDSDQNRGSAI